MVEQIEAFGAELNGHALDRAEVLEERSIKVGAPRTEEYVAAGIAEHKLGRRGEGGLIEPVANVLTTGEIAVGDPIGTAGGAGVDGRVGQLGCEGKSGLGLQDAVDLPTAEDGSPQAACPEARELVRQAHGEAMADIESRVAAIAEAAARVLRSAGAAAEVGGDVIDGMRPGITE